jgi:glucose repression regulatory protein TUP1
MKSGLDKRWVAHEQDVYSLDISSDGKYIATASADRTVKVWTSMSQEHDIYHGNGTPNKFQHFILQDGLTSVAISPDCRFVAASSLDRSIYVWDIASGSMIAEFTGHVNSPYSLVFSPSSSRIISGSLDKTLRVWELDPTVRRTAGSNHFGGSSVQIFEGHAVCCISLVVDRFIDQNDLGLRTISSNHS